MGLYKEGIQQAKEASEIFERLGNTTKQAGCLVSLAYALCYDKQLNAAEEAASRAIDLLPEEGEQLQACQGHHVLGNIYQSKGNTEKAIHHYEVALEIASSLNLDNELFWVHYSLAQLFFGEDRFDDAHTHIENAKSHTTSGTYKLGRAMQLQADLWYDQGMFEKARSGALHAADIYEKLGAALDLEGCRELLRRIDEELNRPVVSDESDIGGEHLSPWKCHRFPRVLKFHPRVRKLNEPSLPQFLRRDPRAIYRRRCSPYLAHPCVASFCDHYHHTFPLLSSMNVLPTVPSARTRFMFVVPPFTISYDAFAQIRASSANFFSNFWTR